MDFVLLFGYNSVMKELNCEKLLLKDYQKSIYRKFVRGVREYGLIEQGDRIAVCVSGGKDSMLMAKCLQLLQARCPFSFELVFLVMDPGYAPEDVECIRDNLAALGIPAEVCQSDLFAVLREMQAEHCFMCARMRRGVLYGLAQERGCNKIALGHHFDDAVETILLSLFYGGEYKALMPMIQSQNHPGMRLIRPMLLVKEQAVLAWAQAVGRRFLHCGCTIVRGRQGHATKRAEIKALVTRLRQVSPHIDNNIFASAHNVNLDTLYGYHSKRRNIARRSFLEDFKGGAEGCPDATCP